MKELTLLSELLLRWPALPLAKKSDAEDWKGGYFNFTEKFPNQSNY